MLAPTFNPNRGDFAQPQLPYGDKALTADLKRVRDAWRESRRQHDRFSVYQYLTAVFDLVSVWQKENRAVARADRALWMRHQERLEHIEPFAAVIRCTSSRKKVNAKARSKWARVLYYAAAFKSPKERLGQFIRAKGGLNACAAEYSQRLGRWKKRRR